MFKPSYHYIAACIILFGACKNKQNAYVPPADPLFTQMDKAQTGISFRNDLKEDASFNVFNYRNFYNGAGVGIGDINNDGLADVYFTSNLGKNHLYLNKGDMRFEDITERAGVGGSKAWSTGVAMADVNGDGLLDIYVCNSGNIKGDDRANELFINQGNLTFKEEAVPYGLEEKGGLTTHAVFFDYDLDGDLDCYILNNSFRPIASFGYNKNIRNVRDSIGGHKLYRNDDAGGRRKFTDVSEQAGIYGSEIGFGLGVSVADVNADQWPDIYVSNDFFEKDYLYINQKNGTFKESIEESTGHLSLASMGSDIADINNDGRPDIFTTEMLPEDDYKLKTVTQFDDYDVFNAKVKGDFYYQYLQNALHLNNGDSTFSEISFLANVAATDWSWGALIFDFDNDGWKDILVCNGIYKDITNKDFIDFLANDKNRIRVITEGKFNFKEFLDSIASNSVPNYAFINQKNLSFLNQSYRLGLGMPGFSNGAAYGDLDNDGDLDLVVNNVNMEAFVYRNNATQKLHSAYLKVKLQGAGENRLGIGAKILVYAGGQVHNLYQMLSRGFQSSVDPVLVVGLGNNVSIDSLVVVWPDMRKQTLKNVSINTTLLLKQEEANEKFVQQPPAHPLYTDVSAKFISGGSAHRENLFIDFDRERLMPKMISMEGPKCTVADVNADGLDDIFIGGAKSDFGKLFFQQANGTLIRSQQQAFAIANTTDQTGAAFFDADKDGDNDLLIVYGGNEDKGTTATLRPRLFLNDGKGNFSYAPQNLPVITTTASCARIADMDNDGDIDVFIGGRVLPGEYGLTPNSFLLVNDGAGKFTDQTDNYAPGLKNVGMVTDARWTDTDNDGKPELAVVGDWMPLTIFKNTNGKLVKSELPFSRGWWNCIQTADLNGDGNVDFVMGNLGLNSKIKGDVAHPVELYVKDFDKNGQTESVLCYYKSDSISYPLPLRGDIVMQLPGLKKKFLKYADYAGKTIHQVFSEEELEGAIIRKAEQFNTCIAINDGKGNFTLKPLPLHAQFSPTYGILTNDLDGDGLTDILLGGNFFGVKPEIGRYDASYSCFLKGDEKGNYTFVPNAKTGMIVKGEVRDIIQLNNKKSSSILFIKNNDEVQVFKRNR